MGGEGISTKSSLIIKASLKEDLKEDLKEESKEINNEERLLQEEISGVQPDAWPWHHPRYHRFSFSGSS